MWTDLRGLLTCASISLTLHFLSSAWPTSPKVNGYRRDYMKMTDCSCWRQPPYPNRILHPQLLQDLPLQALHQLISLNHHYTLTPLLQLFLHPWIHPPYLLLYLSSLPHLASSTHPTPMQPPVSQEAPLSPVDQSTHPPPSTPSPLPMDSSTPSPPPMDLSMPSCPPVDHCIPSLPCPIPSPPSTPSPPSINHSTSSPPPSMYHSTPSPTPSPPSTDYFTPSPRIILHPLHLLSLSLFLWRIILCLLHSEYIIFPSCNLHFHKKPPPPPPILPYTPPCLRTPLIYLNIHLFNTQHTTVPVQHSLKIG